MSSTPLASAPTAIDLSSISAPDRVAALASAWMSWRRLMEKMRSSARSLAAIVLMTRLRWSRDSRIRNGAAPTMASSQAPTAFSTRMRLYHVKIAEPYARM